MRDENEVGYDEADTVDEGEELDVLDEIETCSIDYDRLRSVQLYSE